MTKCGVLFYSTQLVQIETKLNVKAYFLLFVTEKRQKSTENMSQKPGSSQICSNHDNSAAAETFNSFSEFLVLFAVEDKVKLCCESTVTVHCRLSCLSHPL